MSNIHKTTNYSQFKLFESNRKLHGNKILESIKKKNLLHECPIKVTKDFYVIDGQHRLDAAKQLNIPIYYCISNDLGEDAIPLLQNQNSWTLQDFTHFYSISNDRYKFIEEIDQKFNLPHTFIITVCSTGFSPTRIYKEGKLRFSLSKEKLNDNFQKIKDVIIVLKEITSRPILNAVLLACWKIINSINYEHEEFIRKLYNYPSAVKLACRLQSRTEIYNHLIEHVFNKYIKDEKKKMKIVEFNPRTFLQPTCNQI